MLKLTDFSASYGQSTVIDKLSLEIKKGEIEATTEKYTIDQANSTLTINSDATGVVVIGKDESSSNLALKSLSTNITRVIYLDDIESPTSNFITTKKFKHKYNSCDIFG